MVYSPNLVLHNKPAMKIIKSTPISAFGGMNFVFEHFNSLKINQIINTNLPNLAPQSQYKWQDLFYSFSTIFFCGGDCIEDLQSHLKSHFLGNPFVQYSSPDTLLRRFSELTTSIQYCTPKRGIVKHEFCTNDLLTKLNLKILKRIDVFREKELTLDYDNTIIFTEKKDAKMSYKRDYGYQPGVFTVNEKFVLSIENRNGNSDAKSFQRDTLERLFSIVEAENLPKFNHFRADAASYQFDVVKLVEQKTENFYIGCRNSYVEKYFKEVKHWEPYLFGNDQMEIGEIEIQPFLIDYKRQGSEIKNYRLVVKRTPRIDGQIDLISQDAYEYRAILTNNSKWNMQKIVQFYNRRGNMEKTFDVLKNDFGWNNMPFSSLNKNLVFLYFSAICSNLFLNIITKFSEKSKWLEPNYRIKKFIFRFIIQPTKWVKQSRQNKLKIYNPSFEFY